MRHRCERLGSRHARDRNDQNQPAGKPHTTHAKQRSSTVIELGCIRCQMAAIRPFVSRPPPRRCSAACLLGSATRRLAVCTLFYTP